MTGPGRLAAERLPHAGAGAVLCAAPTSRPSRARGMPSWRQVLEAVADAWDRPRGRDPRGRRPRIAERPARRSAASAVGEPLTRRRSPRRWPGSGRPTTRATAASAARRSSRPRPPSSCCCDAARRSRRSRRSGRWPRGGIYDQVGGGFARYSVDARWLVPHFEKMLYDNALLARAYLHGWQVSGDPLLREVTETTLDWMLREMHGPEGGFYSALDADSEGVEGRFYVWSLDELEEVLGDEADEAAAWFGATRRGNFEGTNILVRGDGRARRQLDEWRAALYEARAQARLARPRRQAADRLERPRHLGAGRGRRGARAARLPRRGPPLRRLRAGRAARGGRAAAAHLEGRPRAPERLPGGPRLPRWRRCSPSTRRPSSRAGSRPPASWPTR